MRTEWIAIWLVAVVGFCCATDFADDNFRVHKPSANVGVGRRATFYCDLLTPNVSVNLCQVQSPANEVWTLNSEGQFENENGEVQVGYSEVDATLRSTRCGVVIESLAQVDVGDWSCIIARNGDMITPTVRGIVNLRTTGDVQDVRLPTNTIPKHYDVNIVAILDDSNFSILDQFKTDSEVAIITDVTMENSANDGLLVLNNRLSTINEDSVRLSDGTNDLVILEHIYDFERFLYKVRYVPPGPASFELTFSTKYKGIINQNTPLGFYRDSYVDRTSGDRVNIAVTQFESARARSAFPCLDEPNLKATFNINIGRHISAKSQSNQPLLNSGTPVEGYPEYVWDEYQTTVVQSTYLVAFAVNYHDNVVADPLDNQITYKIHARPDAITDGLADYAKGFASNVLRYFENEWQLPFPLVKMDQIAMPLEGGAMENWGMITYGEFVVLIDEQKASDIDRYTLALTNAHEIAHQWFGDIVTMDWWTHIWLNEGFAVYVSYMGVANVEPDMRCWDRFYVDEMLPILRSDADPDSRVMLEEIIRPGNTNFGDITYKRGGTMIRMMEGFLTKNTLYRGLRDYLASNTYDNTVTDDLWDDLTRVAHQDGTLDPALSVKVVMDPWLKQNNYPVVTVTRDYSSGTVSLTQERFLLQGDNTGDNHKWFIPISWTLVADGLSDFDKTFDFFFDPDRQVNFAINDNVNPVIFNIQNSGYYRVDYDSQNWNLIVNYLNNVANDINTIHFLNRAQLLSDSFDLAEAGRQDYQLPLDIATYLTRETDYTPLATAKVILNRLLNKLLPGGPAEQQLEEFLRNIFSTLYDTVGMDENPDNTFMDNIFQTMVVSEACVHNFPSCVADATGLFQFWMSLPDPDSVNPINRNVKAAVYCAAIRNGGQAEVDFLTARSANVWNQQEEIYILEGLACSALPRNLEQLLDMTSTDFKFGQFNLLHALSAVSNHKHGLMVATQWVLDHFEVTLEPEFDLDQVAQIMATAYSALGNSPAHLQSLAQLSTIFSHDDDMALRFAKAIEDVKSNIAWNQRHALQIRDILMEKNHQLAVSQ